MTHIRIEHRKSSRWLILVALTVAVSFGTARSEANDRPARIRGASAHAGPAVVSIRPAGVAVAPIAPPFVPPFLRFGRPPLPAPGGVIREQGPLGSGLIVDAKRGLILTSASALRGSSRVEILFHDGAIRESRRVVFGDSRDDLALIEFDPQDAELSQAEWGDSGAIHLGDDVLVVGRSARGDLLTSAGIVSAERRSAQAGSELEPIATDALVVRETAGGPLLDLNGRVVGICRGERGLVAGVGEPRAGFGFATPATLARAAVDDLAGGGQRRRGHLGVVLGNVVRGPGEPIGRPLGVVVTAVVPGSAAAEAGIEPGDRILSVDGRDVPSVAALSRTVENAPVGTELTLRIERQGAEIEIRARTRADAPRPSATAPGPSIRSEPGLDPTDEGGEPSDVQEQPAESSDLPPAIFDEPESEGR